MGASKSAAGKLLPGAPTSSTTKTRLQTVAFFPAMLLGLERFRFSAPLPEADRGGRAGSPSPHPQHLCAIFMTIPEARQPGAPRLRPCRDQSVGWRGKIMVLDMGKPVRIADLAERMIQLAGFRPRIDIDIVYSGLRPGEKMVEELFDPNEDSGGGGGTGPRGGYMLADAAFSPTASCCRRPSARSRNTPRAEQTDRGHATSRTCSCRKSRKWIRNRDEEQGVPLILSEAVRAGVVALGQAGRRQHSLAGGKGRTPADPPRPGPEGAAFTTDL